MRLKEIFTARYDPRTEQIEGCTPFGFIWHHENRHKQQLYNKDISNFDYFTSLIATIAKGILIVSFIAGFNNPIHFIEGAKIAIYLFIPSIVFNIVLEWDANVYAWRKKKR